MAWCVAVISLLAKPQAGSHPNRSIRPEDDRMSIADGPTPAPAAPPAAAPPATGAAAALASTLAEIERILPGVDVRSRHYKRMFFAYTIATASLSALTTVLIGAGQIYEVRWPAVAALATSGLLTVAVAVTANFRYRDMWVHKNTILSELKEVQSRLVLARTLGGAAASEAVVRALYEQYQDTMRRSNDRWKGIRDEKAAGARGAG
jgi:hypothetical protein